MFENSKKHSEGKPIKGIACNVGNCAYNDGECHCTAQKVSVGPSYAKSCTDTVCATFIPEAEG
ncbi:MAG: DUF1540 domain-containing protein [Clostridia bacterium]|nr:DUF1540 domain-containing protein [Clostridia bacterium]